MLAMKRPPNNFQAIYQRIDVAGVVVKRQGRPAARLASQPRQKRLGAVMPCADGHVFLIKNACHVVWVNALERLGLLTPEGGLTNAAAALFCKSRTPMLKTGVLGSRDRVDILDVQQVEGTLFDRARKAEFYVLSNIRRRVVIEGAGIERREVPELPMPAVREAIVNGLAHADYQSGEAMQVDVFADSVEICNSGWFFDGQTPEARLAGEDKRSKSRNPLIASALFKSKDIESYGTGMPRIKRLCDAEGVKVEYLKVPGGTRVVFHRRDPFGRPGAVEVWPKLGRSSIERDGSLSPRERSACAALLERGESSSTDVAERLGTSVRTARRALPGGSNASPLQTSRSVRDAEVSLTDHVTERRADLVRAGHGIA